MIKNLPGRNCIVALAAFLVLLTGCVARRIAWTPDGAHAAIIGDQGLYICEPDGALSGILASNIVLVDWFSDSHRLAVVGVVREKSWKEVQNLLPAEEKQRVLEFGKTALDALAGGHDITNALGGLTGLRGAEQDAVQLYLQELDGVKEKVGTNTGLWAAQKEVNLAQVRVGTFADGKVSLGAPLISSLCEIDDVRVAPSGTAIAFATDLDKDGTLLRVVPADGSSPAQVVDTGTALCADWSADSRSLVYVKSTSPVNNGDKITLGSLTRRGVMDGSGKIAIAQQGEDLAGLVFDGMDKVRCTADGRIIFAALDIHLPSTSLDMPEKGQLFAIDPARQQGVIPLFPRSVQEILPSKIGYYETSPDGNEVAFCGDKSGVFILTIATGRWETVQPDGNLDTMSAPAWRSTNELSYIRTESDKPAQMALWRNGSNQVLSAHWPEEVRTNFLDK